MNQETKNEIIYRLQEIYTLMENIRMHPDNVKLLPHQTKIQLTNALYNSNSKLIKNAYGMIQGLRGKFTEALSVIIQHISNVIRSLDRQRPYLLKTRIRQMFDLSLKKKEMQLEKEKTELKKKFKSLVLLLFRQSMITQQQKQELSGFITQKQQQQHISSQTFYL